MKTINDSKSTENADFSEKSICRLWDKLLWDLKKIPDSPKTRTFMQISGYPHYENVCSNILEFFFDPENEHGLGNLFINALLAACRCDSYGVIDKVNVEREVLCSNNKRLDIVLETEEYVIGIENKIWHHAEFNPFETYKCLIDERAGNKKKAIYIILSLKKEANVGIEHDFKNVLYGDFWDQIKSRLGFHTVNAHSKYLIYLKDFMQTIEELQGSDMQNQEIMDFFKENYIAVEQVIERYNNYKKYLNNKILILKEEVNIDCPNVNQWIFAKSNLVHDFSINGGTIAMDSWVDPGGWEISLFLRQGEIHETFNKLIDYLKNKLPIENLRIDGKRYFIEQLSVDADIDKIAKTVNRIIALIRVFLTEKESLQA
jgi:hypothetical protein